MPKVCEPETTREANILAATKSVVSALRRELADERHDHDLTRGDLRRANERIAELEAALGFHIPEEPPTSPEIPKAIRAAKES